MHGDFQRIEQEGHRHYIRGKPATGRGIVVHRETAREERPNVTVVPADSTLPVLPAPHVPVPPTFLWNGQLGSGRDLALVVGSRPRGRSTSVAAKPSPSFSANQISNITMGFLKRILRNGVSDDTLRGVSNGSFESLTDDELQAHMGIDTYGVFDLTDAIRPSYDLQVIPRQGFRFDEYIDDATGTKTPVIMASATRHLLMDLFLELDRIARVGGGRRVGNQPSGRGRPRRSVPRTHRHAGAQERPARI